MSADVPPGAIPPDPGQHWGPPPSASSYPSVQAPPIPSIAFGRSARWPTFTALAIALIALAVGIVGWFRPTSHNIESPPKPTYTDQQIATAKANVCAAFGQIDKALAVAGSFSGSSDQTAVLAVATSTRQVLDFGNRYLLTTLTQEPAAPADLATAVRKQADAYQKLLVGYLDGLHYGDPDLQPATNASVEAEDTVKQLCK
jgi:hypothetical protein